MEKLDILQSFSRATGIPIDRVAEKSMNFLPRTDLIMVLEKLEKETGRIVCRGIRRPLAWLDSHNITFKDIAAFFAEGNGKISDIYYDCPKEELLDLEITVHGIISTATKNEKKITCRTLLHDIVYHNGKHFVHVFEQIENMLKEYISEDILGARIEMAYTIAEQEDATVGDIRAVFANAYETQWCLRPAA